LTDILYHDNQQQLAFDYFFPFFPTFLVKFFLKKLTISPLIIKKK